ncbi:Sensor histidine kinase YycG [Anatilimnocola aggregata]|uniref:histidine kinase n=1 Tax=Anatilimnocola aggregata TaxID=2528021 RepID=A0A517YIJ0_9BACT|nr:HAMP domain-containing sensor histidine kinase [Anatilimnocola aggregata]QDU30047.1 Sensor histidine kinase YycG [Anatilimnocola aggregata]
MRRPWHYWATFLLGLSIVLPAMLWLTIKAMELDRANAVAIRQAELEQDIGRALWRMDALLTPLLAQEAARPDFVYRTQYATLADAESASKAPGKPPTPVQTLSPLVAEPPPFVLLHFEVLPDGSVVSPQAPTAKDANWALDNGARQETLDAAGERLLELQQVLADMPLADQLPQETLPLAGIVLDINSGTNSLAQNNANPPIFNKAYTQPRANFYGNNYQSPQFADNQTPNAPAPQPVAPNPEPPPAQQGQLSPQRGTQFPQQQAARQQSDFSNEPLLPPTQEETQQLAQVDGLNQGNFQATRSSRSQQQSRAGNDLENRDAALQAFAQKAISEQRLNQRVVMETAPAVEGVSQPLWLGGRLLLARRVQIGNQVRVQGCWLDWPALQRRLKEEVADLLPNVDLTPVTSTEPIKLSRLLASLPVQLSVPMPAAEPAPFSPIRVSLLVAWSCLILVSIAAAITLQSVVTLSERRASFVSAVTHELRTPLTTFRMYAEMLAGGMVPEAEQRQRYLETLRVEADRLAHLVDNVLQYARLERTNPSRRRQQVAVHELFERMQERLADRASQAEMQLVVQTESCPDQTLVTDPQAVEQILFNLVDNACKYAAHADKKEINLSVTCLAEKLLICVRDFGPGISSAGRKKLFRPFSKSVHDAAHSAPGVGLGLALCERLARDLGGRLQFQPAEPGCNFCLSLPLK